MPEEIAILGIGNDAFLCENQTVPLSSVDDELERNGSEAAALLERLMEGQGVPSAPVLVPCTRVWARRSTDTLATESPVLRRALEILSARLASPPSMVELAEAVGVSRATLDRLFLREFGRPAHAELLRRRIARARNMLRDTLLSVAAISDECGFCNPGYFAVAFARSEVGALAPVPRRREDGNARHHGSSDRSKRKLRNSRPLCSVGICWNCSAIEMICLQSPPASSGTERYTVCQVSGSLSVR